MDEEAVKRKGTDFTNMVVFCRKTTAGLRFRAATRKDFLKSQAREMFLQPKHEVQILDFLGSERDGVLLRNNNTEMMRSWHETSALGHWEVMRTVLPAKMWEMW